MSPSKSCRLCHDRPWWNVHLLLDGQKRSRGLTAARFPILQRVVSCFAEGEYLQQLKVNPLEKLITCLDMALTPAQTDVRQVLVVVDENWGYKHRVQIYCLSKEPIVIGQDTVLHHGLCYPAANGSLERMDKTNHILWESDVQIWLILTAEFIIASHVIYPLRIYIVVSSRK